MRVQQDDLFPLQKEKVDLGYQIDDCFREAQDKLKSIGTQAKFFKTLGEYIVNLNARKDREAVLENIVLAKEKATDFLSLLSEIEDNLLKADAFGDRLEKIRAELDGPDVNMPSDNVSTEPLTSETLEEAAELINGGERIENEADQEPL